MTATPRVALVAGVGRSLGPAVCARLGADGWRVIAAGRRAEHVNDACRAVTEAGGVAHAIVDDVSEPGWLEALADHEPVDAVVWVASAYAPFARIGATSVTAYDEVLATTLRAPFLLARAVVPGMCERGFGRFVALGSAAASHGGAGQAAYASAKAGLTGLVRTLAAEGGPRGVTANVLELGYVHTARAATLPDATRAAFVTRSAVRRAASPDEIARIVAFFVGDASGFVTGAVIPVDGGLGVGLA